MDFCHKEDILTSHGPHNREYGATYPYSYLNQCTYLKIPDFDITKTYWPLMGPHSWERDAISTPHSSLCQHAYLTNKHNHFKNMRGWNTQNGHFKEKCIWISGFWHKEDIHWPLMDLLLWNVMLLTPILVWVSMSSYS